MPMELKVDELQEIAPIGFNYDELKQEMKEKLVKYKGMVYTEADLSVAKDDRATLNRLGKALNDRRISLEKEYMLPFNEFKDKVNELITLINEPVKIIDDQVKAFEVKQKEEKKKQIQEKYDVIVTDDTISKLLPLTRIWNDKWLNSSYKMKDIETEIQTAYDNLIRDMNLIRGMNTDFENRLIEVYLIKLDISEVLLEKTRLEEQQRQIEEMKAKREAAAKEEAERKAAAEAQRAAERAAAQEKAAAEEAMAKGIPESFGQDSNGNDIEGVTITKAPEEDNTDPKGMASNIDEEAPATETMEHIEFWINVTKEQKNAVKVFLQENKIQFGKVVR